MILKSHKTSLRRVHTVGIVCFCLFFFMACKKEKEPEPVLEKGTLSDVEGNSYQTVKIGNRWWMAENLKVQHFNDSTPIPRVELQSVINDSIWKNSSTAACSVLDARFGVVYNQFCIQNKKNLAPIGWHVPTDAEWKEMERAIGMSKTESDKSGWRGTNEAEKLIIGGSGGWPAESTVFGDNSSGFSALPGGCRVFNGNIGELFVAGYWWTASLNSGNEYLYRSVNAQYYQVFRFWANAGYGMSIRCVKDE
jgi:uncharacterized protein (TIGR02145 family)